MQLCVKVLVGDYFAANYCNYNKSKFNPLMDKLNMFKFQPGAMSIIQMGEELIGHPTTAINELVKNGYDADATRANVYVHYCKEKDKSFILISDNGLGMNSGVLFGNWLQPSVSSKRNGNNKSQVFQRNFLGSKGIGRLASMALGRYLTVISKTSVEKSYNWLTIDRQVFRQEKLLSTIEFPGGKTDDINTIFKNEQVIAYKNKISSSAIVDYLNIKFKNGFTEGTIILIEQLDNSISTIIEDEFLNGDIAIENISLIRSLKILITPLLLNPTIQQELIEAEILDNKYDLSLPESIFEIHFGCNLLPLGSFPNRELKIEEFSILPNYDYRVLGKVLNDGSVNGVYYCNRLMEDSFNSEFKLSSADTFSDEARVRVVAGLDKKEITSSKVGEFFFDIRVFDRDPDTMEKLSKLLKVTNRRAAAYLLDEIVGLRISKNGFGIKPYGEEEKDWMGLGQMRVQNPTAVIGTNQLIGNVFLFSPENDALNEKSNREGFFETEAFINFKKILRAILIEAGKRRYNYRQKHGIGRVVKSKYKRPDSTRFLDLVKNLTDNKKVLDEAQELVTGITTTLDNLENSLTFSQRLATLGSGLELVYHELAQPISTIGKSLYSLKFPIGKIKDNNLRDEFLDEVKHVRIALNTLDELKNSLEPAIGRSRVKEFKPLDTFNKVCYILTKDIISYEIYVDVDGSLNDYKIKDQEYYLWIAFLNILNNAVYWLKTVDKSSRKISLVRGENNELIISNNGPKIPQDELENIFNYGVTLKKEKNATGLGLAFTRSILTTNDWEIWAENQEQGPAFILKKQN